MDKEYKYMVATLCKTFNHAFYIKDALNGFAMQQTTFPCVYIVIDDASTDGEQDVIHKWAQRYLMLSDDSHQILPYGERYVAQLKNNTLSLFVIILLTENHHGKKSKRPYIAMWLDDAKYRAFCEGDDYWIDPYKLQKQVNYMEDNKDCSLCFGNVRYYDCERDIVKGDMGTLHKKQNSRLEHLSKQNTFYHLLQDKSQIQFLTALCRSSCLNKIVQNTKFMMGDTPLWLDLSQQGRIKYLNELLGNYNIHSNSITHSKAIRARFTLSMYEMRVYYCHKYKYEVPRSLKRKYNYAYVNCIVNNQMCPSPMYEIFNTGWLYVRVVENLLKNKRFLIFYVNFIHPFVSALRIMMIKWKMLCKFIYNKL